MKLNNHGLSSREMLTVLIIICMILVMLVPTILNTIEFSGKKIMMNNVAVFRNEIDITIMSYINGGKDISDGCYYIMQSGDLCLGDYDSSNDMCDSDKLVIALDGTKPQSGTVDINNNKVSDICNIRMKNFFINVDDSSKYYISEEPRAQTVCRR